MFLAKVTGSVVATQKVKSMTGYKLLLVEPYRLESEQRRTLTTTGRTFVAVDTLGAGDGEFVLITQGSSAQTDTGNERPADRHRDCRHRGQRACRRSVCLFTG